MTKRLISAFAAALLAALAASSSGGQKMERTWTPPAAIAPAVESVSAESILRHIKALASDEFEGRAPGTRGEERTVAYLVDQLRQLGLKPGNPDGTYVQKVPLVGLTAQPTGSFRVGGETIGLSFPGDWVAFSGRVLPEVKVDSSEVVFVGYGVVAPEYGWDDYKGLDVKGKTIVMLVGDPPVPDVKDPTRLDETMFKGRAMTYYGRWTYKFEIAAEKGAAAALIVHETGPAGYPYEVVQASWGRERFDIETSDGNASAPAVEGWLALDTARRLVAAGGQDFDALKRAAARKEFKPVALGARATFGVRSTIRRVASQNVVARLDGSDATMRNEYVVYSAHWDHFGRNETLEGDQIFNGAVDNASGVAEVLEITKAFARLATPPKRSILVLLPTAEEQGLLGAKYYATTPLYPLERTLADINLDIMNVWGRTKSLVSISLGNTTLDEVLAEVAASQGRVVKPDPEPEKGYFYRSDHLELMRQGVPALAFLHPGADYVGKPADFGERKRAEYVANDYHKVTDEVRVDWDLSGAVEDVKLLFQVGYIVAQGERYPEWKPGTEFKARRERMLERGRH